MKITILGCGSSTGVPMIGCKCAVCTSTDPRNKRTRSAILVEDAGTRILIDTPPDLYQQAISNDLCTIDALLYTHAHADHTHGIDEVRSFNHHGDREIPCYTNAETFTELKERFHYAFLERPRPHWFRPCLLENRIDYLKPFHVGAIEVMPFRQIHGLAGDTVGFRFGSFAYSVDVKTFPEESQPQLYDLDLWIVDCLRKSEAPTHAHLDIALNWIEEYRPKRAILTHMGHDFDYASFKDSLPGGVEPAYDGMVVEV